MTVTNLNPPTFHAWMDEAKCASIGGDLWFPKPNDNHSPQRAIAICRTCPVIAQCEAASRDEVHGIWAALTPQQRARRRNAAA